MVRCVSSLMRISSVILSLSLILICILTLGHIIFCVLIGILILSARVCNVCRSLRPLHDEPVHLQGHLCTPIPWTGGIHPKTSLADSGFPTLSPHLGAGGFQEGQTEVPRQPRPRHLQAQVSCRKPQSAVMNDTHSKLHTHSASTQDTDSGVVPKRVHPCLAPAFRLCGPFSLSFPGFEHPKLHSFHCTQCVHGTCHVGSGHPKDRRSQFSGPRSAA